MARPPVAARTHVSIRNILRGPTVQPKLKIGAANDPAEREADAVAEKVMRMPSPAIGEGAALPTSSLDTGPNPIRRLCNECEGEIRRQPSDEQKDELEVRRMTTGEGGEGAEVDEEELIRPKEVPGAGPALSPASEGAIRGLGGGAPLAASERAFFGPRFGRDFSGVRIHTGAAANASAKSINARAYTLGSDIAFGRGEYAPGTPSGRRLLAHELAHVVKEQEVVRRSEYEDCDNKQATAITTSESDARIMLRHAIKLLTADPVTKSTRTHFANHFGAWANWRRVIVLGHLKAILSRLASADGEDYECEKKCGSELAYVYWIFGDIHICPSWYSRGKKVRAGTIIHEVQHLRGSFDLGYHERNKSADTYWSVAINNADSFSTLVEDLN